MQPKLPAILAVDDEPVWRELIKRFFTHAEYELVTQPNAQEAWDVLKKEPNRFDLLVFAVLGIA